MEDPIEVTSGNLRNEDILVVDSSIAETMRGVSALPHCVMGLFLQQGRLLSQVTSPSSWTQAQPLTLLCSPSPAPPLVVLPPLCPGGEMAQRSVMTAPTVSLLK